MIRLRGITWDHPRGYAPLKASIPGAAARLGLRVDWDVRSLKDFGDAPLEELARNYDLIVMDHPHVGEAARSGCLLPVDEACTAPRLSELSVQSVGPSFDSYRCGGRQWALPMDAACQVASYRPDLMDASDLPVDWDGVFRLASSLRRRGLWMGMALCPTDCLCSFLTLTAQLGDPPIEGRGWIREETTLAAGETLRRLREVCHPDSMKWNPIATYEALSESEDLACCPLAFGYINYAATGFRRHRLAFAGIPGIRGSLLGGAGLAISRRVTEPAKAVEYALWVCGGEYQAGASLEAGGQPWHRAAWKAGSGDPHQAGYCQPIRATLEQAYVRPRSPGWPTFQEILGERLHGLLERGGDLREFHREVRHRFEVLVCQ